MTWENWDDVPLTTEQLIEAASKGVAEVEHNGRVAAQTGQTPTDRLETLSDEDLLAEWQKESAKITNAERDRKAFEAARQFAAECPAYVGSAQCRTAHGVYGSEIWRDVYTHAGRSACGVCGPGRQGIAGSS